MLLEFHHPRGKDKVVRQMTADGLSMGRIKSEIENRSCFVATDSEKKQLRTRAG